MKIEFEYQGYNRRRFSSPWGAIAKVEGNKIVYDFDAGDYIGNDTGGTVIIECEIGDIVATGQRDYRGGNSVNKLYIVEVGGKLKEVERNEAIEYLKKDKVNVSPFDRFSDDELIAEIKRRGLID